MVVQYIHTLTASIQAAGTTDNSGDYIPSSSSPATVTQSCRAESSDGSGYITGSDGKRVDFGWIVYMPLEATKLPIGTAVTIVNGSELVCKDTVKRFSRGQFNCRAWL